MRSNKHTVKYMSNILTASLSFSRSWQWLHQRQLHRWLQEAECLHRHTGASAGDIERLLEDGMGAKIQHHRHDDQTGGEVTGKKRDYDLIWNIDEKGKEITDFIVSKCHILYWFIGMCYMHSIAINHPAVNNN